MVHHTGGRPAVAEDSEQLSAPTSHPLRSLFKCLRDWTIFQGSPRSSVWRIWIQYFPRKLFLTWTCLKLCSDGWEMLEGAGGKGGAKETTGWNRKGFSHRQRWDENEASFTRRAALYSLKCVSTDVDFVTPLCSQVVYEGLVDDIFRIKCGEYE